MTARRLVQFAYVTVLVIVICIYRTQGAGIEAHVIAIVNARAWTGPLAHAAGAATLFTAVVVSVFFSIPPGPLFYLVFGYCFGPVEGTLLAVLATTAGSVGAFWFFRSAVPAGRARSGIKVRNVFLTLMLLRSSPWIPNPLITVFCSAFDVGIVTFTLTTFFGTMPLIMFYAVAASRLSGRFDASVLLSPDIALAFALLSAVSLVGLLKPVRIIRDYLRAIQAEREGTALSPALQADSPPADGSAPPACP